MHSRRAGIAGPGGRIAPRARWGNVNGRERALLFQLLGLSFRAQSSRFADFYHGRRGDRILIAGLEDGDAPRTRQWLAEQDRLLASLPRKSSGGLDRIRKRISETLKCRDMAKFPRSAGERQFFRKAARPTRNKPCIYMREDDKWRRHSAR